MGRKIFTEADIVAGAVLATAHGKVTIVEVLPNYYNNLTGVKSLMDGKGAGDGWDYCDEMSDLLAFLNEESD